MKKDVTVLFKCLNPPPSFSELALVHYTPGCDMRSSDAYFIHARYFDFLSKRLLDYDRATIVPEQYGKHIIDLDGFAALPNQILAVPQWTYQKGGSVDGTNLGMQKADSETFIKQCVTTM